ncbi:MAG: hypothetical protein M3165_03565 [Actinomycetota bacterium]|nr:hypothetical protein [Actinomycetota bacterium]
MLWIPTLRATLLPLTVVGGTLAVALAVAASGGAPADVFGDDQTPATSTRPAAGSGGGGADDCHARETIALPPGLRPEGVTSDGDSTFYVGSLGDGRVVTGDLRTGDTDVLVPGIDGRVAVGMQLDRRHDRLWVAGGPTGAVTVYDAGSGEELGRWVTPGSVFLNDVALTGEAAYVTDSGLSRLVVVPLGDRGELPAADGATTLRLTGDIVVDPDAFNANGIRALSEDRLVLVQSNTGTLFLVDPATGSTDAVEMTRGALVGGDGLELGAGRLFVVRGAGDNTVSVVRLRADEATATVEQVLTDADLDVPTTATFAGGRLWAVNARFGTEPTPTTGYDLVRLAIMD